MSKCISTETGSATLMDDGSMLLDNSGYTQRVSADQVQQVWAGVKELEPPRDVYEKLKAEVLEKFSKKENYDWDMEDVEAVVYGELVESYAYASYDGWYWDFGEEQHTIPSKEDFENDVNFAG